MLRLATDGSPVVAPPALSGKTLLVVTRNGGLFAFRPRVKPVIAIVGRPNVGKSTLFNRLTKSRDAIVADFAGLTRDRHYGDGRHGEHDFIVVDTGGFEPDSQTGIVEEMARQTRQAVAEADAVIFVVDVRTGVSGQDHDIARYLRIGQQARLPGRQQGRGHGRVAAAGGVPRTRHRRAAPGVGGARPGHSQPDRCGARGLRPADEDEASRRPKDAPIRLAVAGRPNVGKSTLINTWLGEERLIAFDQPGTTRDAISVPFERNGQEFELIDTAGLRRKGKVFEAIEKFSVVKTLQAIADANVVLLLLDATQGVTDQDAHIAGYILDSGRAVVIAVNKWDAVDAYQREMLQRSIEQRLAFLKFAPVATSRRSSARASAPVWKAIADAHASAIKKMPTPVLTRLLQEAVDYQAPKRAGALPAQAALCAPGRHEAADRGRCTATRSNT